MMRQTTDDRHGYRVRAMIVVLWRAGLRVQEALALIESDSMIAAGRSSSVTARADFRAHCLLISSGMSSGLQQIEVDRAML